MTGGCSLTSIGGVFERPLGFDLGGFEAGFALFAGATVVGSALSVPDVAFVIAPVSRDGGSIGMAEGGGWQDLDWLLLARADRRADRDGGRESCERPSAAATQRLGRGDPARWPMHVHPPVRSADVDLVSVEDHHRLRGRKLDRARAPPKNDASR